MHPHLSSTLFAILYFFLLHGCVMSDCYININKPRHEVIMKEGCKIEGTDVPGTMGEEINGPRYSLQSIKPH
jgi:hypothetical protein